MTTDCRHWQIPVIAHRGASALAPENTFASMRQAKALGAEWIEFDVMLTCDRQPVVIHDATLRRTTNGKGRVSDKTFAQLQTLDAGSWFSPDFSAERIPHLQQYLKLAGELQLNVNIELKPIARDESCMAEQALEIIDKTLAAGSQVIVSSFSVTMLEQVRKYDKAIKLGFLMHRFRSDHLEILSALNCYSFNVNQRILTEKRVKRIKQSAYHLLSYTVNDPERARQLLNWGVDAVFTDLPEAMHGFLA